jgi:nicotinamidase-related amidase
VPRLKPLIAACRRKKLLVIYACQTDRADGSDRGLKSEIFPGITAHVAPRPA